MNLKPTTQQIAGQKEFLRNTVGMEFKTAGATLDGAAFTPGTYVTAGTAVYKDATSGLYKPWAVGTAATKLGAGLTSHDVKG
jgi:hypothetical protein